MAALPATLVLFLYFTLASSYTLLREDDNEIIWPTEYHFKGEKIDFMTTLKETFEIWYSAEMNRSRFDVYDGTVKKWFYGDTGFAYERHPVTTEEVTNEELCVAWLTEEEQPDFLPDVSELTYTGQSMTLYDKVVDEWTSTNQYEHNLVVEVTLYVFKTDSGIDLPVQKIKKSFNYDVGEMIGHSITNFFDFRDSVTEEELTVENEDECEEMQFGVDFHKEIKFFHPDLPSELDQAFDLYTNHHNKKYQDEEHQMRKRIFEKSWRLVEEHNRQNKSYRLKLNQFSDKTPEELKFLTGTFPSKHKDPDMMPFPHTLTEVDELAQELPEEFDLRMEGAVTPIKNQGQCGSCYAFCTTAAIEGALAKANGERLLDLSEQSLMDCSWGYGNRGCKHGTISGAMKFAFHHGIPTEEEYGLYTATDGFCKIQNVTNPYKIRGFSPVTLTPNALKVSLFKYGPVSMGIRVTDKFRLYSSGLFYDPACETQVNGHCVTIVGYGVRDGEDYWIVKNSWGEIWGEDGYVLMAAKDNNCIIPNTPYYPIV